MACTRPWRPLQLTEKSVHQTTRTLTHTHTPTHIHTPTQYSSPPLHDERLGVGVQEPSVQLQLEHTHRCHALRGSISQAQYKLQYMYRICYYYCIPLVIKGVKNNGENA